MTRQILTVLAIAGSVMSYTRGQAGSACRISQTQEDGTFTFDYIRLHSTSPAVWAMIGDCSSCGTAAARSLSDTVRMSRRARTIRWCSVTVVLPKVLVVQAVYRTQAVDHRSSTTGTLAAVCRSGTWRAGLTVSNDDLHN